MRYVLLLLAVAAVAALAQESQGAEWYANSPLVTSSSAVLRSAKTQIDDSVSQEVAWAPWTGSADLSYYITVVSWTLFIPTAFVSFFNIFAVWVLDHGTHRVWLRSLEFGSQFLKGGSVAIVLFVWHGGSFGATLRTNVTVLTWLAIALFDVLTPIGAAVYTATTMDDTFTKVLILFNTVLQGFLITTLPQNNAGSTQLYPTLAGLFYILGVFNLVHADHLLIHKAEKSGDSRSYWRRMVEGLAATMAYAYFGTAAVLMILYGQKTTFAPTYTLTNWNEQPLAVALFFIFAVQALVMVMFVIRWGMNRSEWFNSIVPDIIKQHTYEPVAGSAKKFGSKKMREPGV